MPALSVRLQNRRGFLRPLVPGDLLASIYHALGIDHAETLPDRSQRPIPLLLEGEPIRELF
ncbi:MAG: hypothetical protein ACM3U2_20365 [Deltaproteobacteria bacterium]